jgi:hypothetical protein
MELPAAMAKAMGLPAGQLGPGDVGARRIAVEPMGKTVGPIPPEEGGPAQSAPPMTPEASPAG